MGKAGKYERELRDIFEAKPDTLDKVVKTCSLEECDDYFLIKDFPFIVIRAAGSFGLDIIALRGEITLAIEVKSSTEDTIHFSRGKLGDQVKQHVKLCSGANMALLYAYRLKGQRGDSWRIFVIPFQNELSGMQGLLQRRLPQPDKSPMGHFIMRWEDGMPLHQFLSYLARIIK